MREDFFARKKRKKIEKKFFYRYPKNRLLTADPSEFLRNLVEENRCYDF